VFGAPRPAAAALESSPRDGDGVFARFLG
jgi:hypothetical protein